MKNSKRKLMIIGAVLAIIIIAIFFMFFSPKSQKSTTPISTGPIGILNSIPKNDSTGASVFDPITITFNQPVDASTINVTSDPAESWTISQTGQDSIEVKHKLYLEVATSYILNILQYGNSIGKLIFETAHEQNDPRQLQSLQSDLDKNYPLASFTPYKTPDFIVVYIAPLTLQIQNNGTISAQDAINKVQSWVQSNGVDPTTHKFVIVAASPSPVP